ncbi:PREDICTED: uncharacterized protein LOC109474781 [Branchiostoma belcheri]|uniref:Uncharacterized protein LOC109474781 n=1 Tax=Branchiostoma belcheri TaxID=7741 RepID=A0A6P4ZM65_BRABE|nr:PREDICTED: uncharacterized protein LOC109474781 [Branchiostoma belcheri]
MGSICREEMTPYSDLEFAILVEEGKCTDQTKTYFRTLTHLLHLKVLNLGETILPSMAIKSLNDFNNKETDWYYDDTTPCGFSFDGSMPWASKTALGRDQTSSKPALELIMTPSEMAELQKDERSVKEGYHLADVLCNVTLISGEQTLVEAYRSKVQELLDLPSQVRLGLTVRAQRGLASLAGFSIAKESILKHLPVLGRPVHVKKVLYRLGSLVVESLGLLFNCTGESVDNTLRNLLQIHALTPEAHHNFSTIVAIVDELRLHTYVANRAQRGLLGYNVTTVKDSRVYNTFDRKHHVIWRRLLYTLIPLHVCVNKFLTAVDRAVHASAITSVTGKGDMIELLRHLIDISRSAFDKDTYRADFFTAHLVSMILSDIPPSVRLLRDDPSVVNCCGTLVKFFEDYWNLKKMTYVDTHTCIMMLLSGAISGIDHRDKHIIKSTPMFGLGVIFVTLMHCVAAHTFYLTRDLLLAREMLDLAINEDKNRMSSNYPLGHIMRQVSSEVCSVISRLSAALGDYTTAVKYVVEELQLIQPFNKREDEMPTRFLLWKTYSELSMPEEAEKHRLRWIHCLHPLLVEAVLMLQNQTSRDDAQSKTVEERFQKFEESLQADRRVVPWDVAVYVLNYSKLLENQKRYVDVDRVYDTALNKLQAWNSSSPNFDTKVYPRMIISQAACLFYMRQGNHGRSLDCLHSVLRYSTLLPVDRVVCACKDHATINYVRFYTEALHFQQNAGGNKDVKHTLLKNIGEVCSIVSFRATAFGPKVADACADCVYDLGEALENMGETLAAVEMFHVGLKICTSQEFFNKALVFLTAMFRARRIPIIHCTCNR